MRITMLLDNHYGPDRRVEREAELLSAAGHTIDILAWDRRPEGSDESIDTGPATVRRLHVPAPPGGGARSVLAVTRFWRRVWSERRELVRGDLVYAHDVYLLPLAARLGPPYVYDAHEDYRLMEAQRFPAPLLRAVTAGETRLARRARLVVVAGRTRVPRWTDAGITPFLLPNSGSARPAQPVDTEVRWDLVCVGNHDETKHPELLVELARIRPDLRVGVAGTGRSAPMLEDASARLTNLDWLGYADEPDALLAQGRAIYYGYDPDHPYGASVAPNTLYQALRVRRPLVFFAGGEMGEAAARFRIGMRVRPDAAAIAGALDQIASADPSAWEFDGAWEWLAVDDVDRRYVEAVERAAA